MNITREQDNIPIIVEEYRYPINLSPSPVEIIKLFALCFKDEPFALKYYESVINIIIVIASCQRIDVCVK